MLYGLARHVRVVIIVRGCANAISWPYVPHLAVVFVGFTGSEPFILQLSRDGTSQAQRKSDATGAVMC